MLMAEYQAWLGYQLLWFQPCLGTYVDSRARRSWKKTLYHTTCYRSDAVYWRRVFLFYFAVRLTD